jgi:long-chain acyl-CoA synthetase
LPGYKSIKQVINLESAPRAPGDISSYQELMAGSSADSLDFEPQSEDIALILYTSGPSLSPRGVMLSHGRMVKEAKIMGDAFQQTDEDVVMLYALPLYHVFGLVAILLTSFFRGSTVVMVPGTGLSISSFMAAIEQERGTIFFGVPYIFALAVDLAEKEGIKHDLSSLRVCSSSADFMPVSLIKRFKDLFGHKILDCFALTEAVCHVSCPSLDGRGKLGSVGKMLPGWEVKIVDDTGRELPGNQHGEIALRGSFMSGYYNNPQATAEVIKNGWLHTGDIGKVDEAGNLYITGRKKDIIIVKGQNIHPVDVETVLFQHPEVAEAAVIGIPDEMRGEVVGAVISLKAGAKAGESELRRWCSDRLASYKVPKQFIFYPSLPRTAMGQIDKAAIRRKLSIPPPSQRIIS